MGGPSAHGQKNKAHKAGRRAGRSARDKHQLKKEGGTVRQSVKATVTASKAQRANASKQQRDAKRQELLDRKRNASAPVVVALLPLSADVDSTALWNGLLAACEAGTPCSKAAAAAGGAAAAAGGAAGGMELDMEAAVVAGGMQTVGVRGRRMRLTLLPPPVDRHDPLSYVELGKSAEVLLLALPGGERCVGVDKEGELALAVLRALGLPNVVGVVQGAGGGSMKERSAAKKRAEAALGTQLAGEHRLFHADSPADCQQLLRHLSEHSVSLPHWRQQRPALMVEAAEFVADEAGQGSGSMQREGQQQGQQQEGQQQEGQQQEEQQQEGQQQEQLGRLYLTGYVRAAGLSANQLMTVPGAGDFRIECIEGPPEPSTSANNLGGDTDMAPAEPRVLATPDPAQQEVLVRCNVPDPLDAEQTWPTDEELKDAEQIAAAQKARRLKRRRLPAGTSEYQAAWILDSDDDDASDDEDGDDDISSEGDGDDGGIADRAGASAAGSFEELQLEDDPGTDGMMMGDDDDESDDEEGRHMRRMREELRSKRLAEADDAEFPDEVDVPEGMPARQRFAKFRGLKSFRSSPWDPREELPMDYGRVFAFDNFKRTHKRALEAQARASSGADPCAVEAGTYVRITLSGVPAAAAQRLVACTQAATAAATAESGCCAPSPPVCYGLLSHECKLSVVNFGMKKAAGYSGSIANKEELLLVTGVRAFVGRPVLSGDEHGADKFKVERFLHEGRHCIGTVYAPIMYPPLPLLAFKLVPGQVPALAATGTVRSCNPDRVALKKVVLTGYPVRVHKARAVVRYMFYNPDDVRWFKPVEVYTKSGRRGRITEPLGTHGGMKCLFDGPVVQRDAVCMSLYKRAYPKWPTDLTFAW